MWFGVCWLFVVQANPENKLFPFKKVNLSKLLSMVLHFALEPTFPKRSENKSQKASLDGF